MEMKILFISCASLFRALCDTKDCGKLSKEQFALAFYLINQKLTKGIDPPQALTPEMIPPSDRSVTLQKVRMALHAWYTFQKAAQEAHQVLANIKFVIISGRKQVLITNK